MAISSNNRCFRINPPPPHCQINCTSNSVFFFFFYRSTSIDVNTAFAFCAQNTAFVVITTNVGNAANNYEAMT